MMYVYTQCTIRSYQDKNDTHYAKKYYKCYTHILERERNHFRKMKRNFLFCFL